MAITLYPTSPDRADQKNKYFSQLYLISLQYFPKTKCVSFITKKKKKICVFQCCSADHCNAKHRKQKPGVKSQSPSQASNHLIHCTGKGRNHPFTSGSRALKMQLEGHLSEMLQWNPSSHSEVRAAAKPPPSIWTPQSEILPWKQIIRFCCIKFLK